MRSKVCRRQAAKIVDEFLALCRTLRKTECPASLVPKTVSDALNIETEFKKFLNNPKNINNNPAEQLNRDVAILRKNCLFAGSERGG